MKTQALLRYVVMDLTNPRGLYEISVGILTVAFAAGALALLLALASGTEKMVDASFKKARPIMGVLVVQPRDEAFTSEQIKFLSQLTQQESKIEALSLVAERKFAELFKKLALPDQLETVKSHFEQIPSMLGGGTEALHDGLLTALTSDLWATGAYSHRMIVLIADEPGDSGGATQPDVLNVMPLPAEIIESLKIDPAKLPKTEFTWLWAIYTEEHGGYDRFRDNVSQLTTGDRIIRIQDFSKNSAMQKHVQEELYASIQDAGKMVNKKVKLLSDVINRFGFNLAGLVMTLVLT